MATAGIHLAASRTTFADLSGGRLREGAGGLHLVVLSPDVELARACLAEELRNVGRGAAATWADLRDTHATHRRLGDAYGYPACCVEAFCDAHAEAVLQGDSLGDNGLAIARAAARSASFHPWLGSLPGAFGAHAPTPLRHLPCRFDCAASLSLAEALYADLARVDPLRHRRLAAGLTRPVWVDRHGVATLASGLERSATHWSVKLPSGASARCPVRPRAGEALLPTVLPFAPRHSPA